MCRQRGPASHSVNYISIGRRLGIIRHLVGRLLGDNNSLATLVMVQVMLCPAEGPNVPEET